MNNCEIVDNVACGKSFQYCRVHKVEPHQCPGAKAAPELDTYAAHLEVAERYWDKVLLETLTPKRELKVGDKVRCLVREFGNETVGKVYVVKEVRKDPFLGLDFRVEADDFGNVNSYSSSNFEVVE